MNFLLQLDGNILLWLQEYVRSDFLTPIMKGITSLGNAGWFWIVLSILLCIPKKTRWLGITGLLALAIGALITNIVLKNWVARIRPYEVVEGLTLLVRKQKDFSFPSGHSCASFAAAVAYYKAQKRTMTDDSLKKWGRVISIASIVIAFLIAFSRLYVGVHYPSDVLGGILIGCGAAWAADWMVKKIQEKQ
ncbi:MAG: phosphatase PAP2 family protein [Hespellia sp.]|nr:phosphatase PAP2 family protein [Hespellia sp.]